MPLSWGGGGMVVANSSLQVTSLGYRTILYYLPYTLASSCKHSLNFLVQKSCVFPHGRLTQTGLIIFCYASGPWYMLLSLPESLSSYLWSLPGLIFRALNSSYPRWSQMLHHHLTLCIYTSYHLLLLMSSFDYCFSFLLEPHCPIWWSLATCGYGALGNG